MITLIATAHSETGVCNSVELEKIIQQVGPLVIFEEIPPSKFDQVYSAKLGDSLESKAIKKYKLTNTISHFPVDLEIQEEKVNYIKKTHIRMNDFFNDYSLEYHQINIDISNSTATFGFPYLNSQKCINLLERKRIIEFEIVNSVRDQQLNIDHKEWLSIIDKRRNEIVNNIYCLSKSNDYSKWLLLIGAEHRKPIIDKISQFEKYNKFKLRWEFEFYK